MTQRIDNGIVLLAVMGLLSGCGSGGFSGGVTTPIGNPEVIVNVTTGDTNVSQNQGNDQRQNTSANTDQYTDSQAEPSIWPTPQPTAAPTGCGSDMDCDDGIFCNGREVCSNGWANGGVCEPGSPPCAGHTCDESTDMCNSYPTPMPTPTPTPTPQSCSAETAHVLRTSGGSLNGVVVDADNYAVTVAPGERIAGTIQVSTLNPMPPTSVAPLGYTVTWGDRITQPVLVTGQVATGYGGYTVSIDKVAPDLPGEYYIIIAFQGQFNVGQIMSETPWTYQGGSPIWYDGNDVGFDWTNDQIDAAIFDGTVPIRRPTDQGLEAACLFATAVVVTVEQQAEPTTLLVNGDFEDGNTGFATDLPYGGLDWGLRAIVTTNPGNQHWAACSCGDHTSGSGQMLAVNVDPPDPTAAIWRQSAYLSTGRAYTLSLWASSWHVPNGDRLRVLVNGAATGQAFEVPTSCGQWTQHTVSWTCALGGSTEIEIVDEAPGGSDVALDDLTLTEQ